jgi:hypothetical protein
MVATTERALEVEVPEDAQRLPRLNELEGFPDEGLEWRAGLGIVERG